MRITGTDILNRSERGTARATLGFPTVVALSNGTLLATNRAGSTRDGADETVEMCRYEDQGLTWGTRWRPFEAPSVDGRRGTLRVCYLTELAPGRLIAAAMWVDRETYPGAPLFNRDTEGCLPMAIVLADSRDWGATWSPWRVVPMPEEIGPPSLTNPILKLADGTLAMSIETNKHYCDRSKWYQGAVLFHSSDGGWTWGGPTTAAFEPTGRIYYWDQRAGVAPDGMVATFLWTYDTAAGTFRNVHRGVSADGGRTWSPLEDLGFADQPSHPAILPDGRVVVAWVDRDATQTIRARLADTVDGTFDPDTEVVLYAHPGPPARSDPKAGALGFATRTFGLPYAEALRDGDVLVVYYAGTESSVDIRWARLRLR